MSIRRTDGSRIPQTFWLALELLGVHPADLLKRAGLSPALHLKAEASVTTSELFSVVSTLEALSPQTGLSLRLAQAMRRSNHTPILHAATHACTFRESIQ